MATINDSMQGVSALWELERRLNFHAQSGQILEGLKIDSEGTLKVDGHNDLPLCQRWAVGSRESFSAGAPRAGVSLGGGSSNQPIAETLTVTYRVATARKYGWTRSDPTDANLPKGFVEWLALIRDAVETADGGETDACLLETINKPPLFTIRESESSQLAFQVYLEMELELNHKCRAERHLLQP